ncbi:DUF3947 family protein [Bacillus sp. RIT 809]|uniref:DUF3947 family protein n=1 Tax=Bacillus sp. RIT 809 TaxID=2803857 RepID=UPI0019512935|nr:DUF3947 family protein [Bacillus sp. RIT 809]MBM6648346.1 hypothetical protein [Bacillus sp. RIT 809]
MRCNYFYNETQMRPLGGQGPAQSTIQAVHQAIQAQQQALQAQQMQHSYYPSQSYYRIYDTLFIVMQKTLKRLFSENRIHMRLG